MKTIILLIFMITLSCQVNAQVFEQWAARYNGPGNGVEYVANICTDNAGNIIVAGSSYTASASEIVVIKYAPAGNIMWIQKYNTTNNGAHFATDVTVDNGGNIFVSGCVPNGIGTCDIIIIKYAPTGVQQWASLVPSANSGYTYAVVALDASGNVFVAGSLFHNGRMKYATIKFNSTGVQQWLLRFELDGDNGSFISALNVDNQGYINVTGTCNRLGNNYEIVTIRYNTAGFPEWVQVYTGIGGNDYCSYAMTSDAQNNVYICGTGEANATTTDGIVVKYNSAGIQQWAVRYNGAANKNDNINSIALDNAGNVFTIGMSYINDTNAECITLKYNSSGIQQWIRKYNGPNAPLGSHGGADIVCDRYGNIYIGGGGRIIPGQLQYFTLKYNNAGDTIWSKRYQGPSSGGDVRYMALDSVNNVYVTGINLGVGTGYDIATIKYLQAPLATILVSPANNATGQPLIPLLDWNDTPNAVTYNVQVSTDSNFTSTVVNQQGITQSQYNVPNGILQNNTLYFWRTAAVNQAGQGPWSAVWRFTTGLTGITQISAETPKQFKLYNNYPNPFNPSTKIKFDVPKFSPNVSVKVYDILGKEAAVLVNMQLDPGSYEAEFSGEAFSSGVYFYRIITQDFTDLKKMILVK